MNCDECQAWISGALDGKPCEPLGAKAEQHLAACAACESFERALRALEPGLKLRANRPRLPADFVSTVMLRLPAAPKRLNAEEILRRRAQYPRGHRAALAALKRRFWPWRFAGNLPRLAILSAAGGGTWLVATQAETTLRPLIAAWPPLNGLNGSMALALMLALAAVIWHWKLRGARRHWPRRFQTLARSLRVRGLMRCYPG